MADRHVEHLLVGGGIAGASAARTLREQGADGEILLVGRELDAPYHRPPITKGYLRGSETREDGAICPVEWWAENSVELLMRTSVMELDTAERRAKLSTKQTIEFGTAMLATGAMVRRLAVDGSQLEGIHYLRAPGNADALRADLVDAERVVVIGGSYIGCEVAASLAELGKRCTVVMQEALPLERGFGRRAGAFFARVLEEHGIELRGESEVEAFEGDERVGVVLLNSGDSVDADAVVCGVGATPDVMLARKSGLALGELGGVLCDARLQTSAPGVYAAGDMCEYDSELHGRVVRIEHEDVAEQQGATAARNMLGAGDSHVAVPYFFSDLSDWASLEYVGPAARWDREVVRGSIDDGEFSIFYLDSGRVVGALSVGRTADLDEARELLRSGAALPDA
ncbi:MAG: NAD(P)/FAD-dependent oxidoreductase [Solirubrobacteraceae bacterium]